MPRDKRHLFLNEIGEGQAFKPKTSGSSKHPSDVADRAVHAQKLLRALDNLPTALDAATPGVYLNIEARPGEKLKTDSLNASGLTLLTVREARPDTDQGTEATVFATPKGLAALRKKITQFETEDTPVTEKGTGGRPKHADLVQSINDIAEAGLRKLWRSPSERFPAGLGCSDWEVWLEKDQAEDFIAAATRQGVLFAPDRLEFPEDVVVLAHATPLILATAIRSLGIVKALAAPSNMTDFFDAMPVDQQDG